MFILEILTLIFTGITSAAGIKYILSTWKVRKIAKKLEKGTISDKDLSLIAQKQDYRNVVRSFLQGENPFIDALKEVLRELSFDIQHKLDDINRTLQNFDNYKKPEK